MHYSEDPATRDLERPLGASIEPAAEDHLAGDGGGETDSEAGIERPHIFQLAVHIPSGMLALVHNPFSHPSPDVAHRPPQQKRKSSSSLSQSAPVPASASSSSTTPSSSSSFSSASTVASTTSRSTIIPTAPISSATPATTAALASNINTQTQSHHAASSAQHQSHSVLVNTHGQAHGAYQAPRSVSAGGAPNGHHQHHHHHHQNKPTTPNYRSATPTAPSASPSSASPVPEPIPSVDIHSYPPTDLLKLLASLLTQIAAANDKLLTSPPHIPTSSSSTTSISTAPSTAHYPPIWHTLTTASRSALSTPASTLTFHARNVPTITLEAYLLRILKYCPTTNHVFLSLLVYFDRMSKMSLDATGRTFVIDSYNIHRLVIAGVTVASKFFSDVFYTNSRYAKVGGLPLPELNQLELQFLLLNDFRLVISTAEMQHYANQLILFSRSSRPAPSPSLSPSSAPHVVSSTSISSTGRGTGGGDEARRMGAIDAFGGKVPVGHAQPRSQSTQPGEQDWDTRSTCTSSSTSEAGDETETDGETDDEPTIRPAKSVADTESVKGDEEEGMEVDGERTPERRGRDI
ncbi:cyclin-domain-containing protein [Cyathus striatus]|nr:cyclin-domain-containing protein [Cyathus striatus]